MQMKGKLYMIPTLLAENTQEVVLTSFLKQTIGKIETFLCENVRSARRFVASLHMHDTVERLHFDLLDKDTGIKDIAKLLEPLHRGIDMGLLSESGCPGIADPGAMAVDYAHRHGFQVVPLVGPSSILLALMASGLNGQRFAFHGYLPIDSKEASIAIRNLEHESRDKSQTQIFIETPYRNNPLLSHLLKTLHPDTRLCVALNLTASDEKIICQDICEWKKQTTILDKIPATFLFLAREKDVVNS